MAEETKKGKSNEKKRVRIMVPKIDGQDPEQTVIVNYHVTKFKKGKTVDVSPEVAEVLENSYAQMALAEENQEKFKSQVTDL